jgi:hypothetical protein
MTITNQDVDVYRGDSALLEISLTDANGDPFALTAGGTLKYRVAPTAHSSEDESVIRKELGAGIDLFDGVAEITLLSDDTDHIVPEDYYHELKIYDLGDVATAMTGNFKVRQSLQMPQVRQATVNISMTAKVNINAIKVP